MEESLTNYLLGFLKETLKFNDRVKEVSLKNLHLLSKGLRSIYPIHRKISSILILYLCDLKHNNIEIFLKSRLLLSFAGYIGVGVSPRGKLKKTKKFIKKLHKDPQFMKEETKSNRLYIKFFKRVEGNPYRESRKEVFILTLTEITHFIGGSIFDSIPDPVETFVWCLERKDPSKVSSLKEIAEKEYETKEMLYEVKSKVRDLSRSCSIEKKMVKHDGEQSKLQRVKESVRAPSLKNRRYRITKKSASIDISSSPFELRTPSKIGTPSTAETKKPRFSVSRGRRRRGRSRTTVEKNKEKINIFKPKNAPLFRIKVSVDKKRGEILGKGKEDYSENTSKLIFQRRRKKRTISYIHPSTSTGDKTPSFFKTIRRKKLKKFKDMLEDEKE